ncbi:flagellar hook-associated protein FlgK [Clostridium sp. 19966]|uniref:flagellar hook-associated protein FlgK n=1 Tax=Clostridium sp. 19966 TaxID=2768166 RepID=UPI0028DFE6D2|nr:flagellar hook-associated protein FlgK [Clostridium sp. 19966]MDT8716673.1 flagellar hook-associated protein FlgK [Clostridium sp. 19966]
MSGLFSTFNIAKSGMFTQQKAIDVTSHNIANANTDGYSRQRANIETTRPFSDGSAGQLGTGAQVSSIDRIRDSFLDYQVRNETSTYGTYNTRNDILGQVQNIFNEPTNSGIGSLIDKFFSSWSQLSKQPQSSDARTVVAQQSVALTDELNHTYSQLKDLQDNNNDLIKNSVFQTNSILNQLDALNSQIIGVEAQGNSPNDLMDKRDSLLDQLSEQFGITIDKKSFGGVDVKPTDSDGVLYPQLVQAENPQDEKRLAYVSGIDKDTSDPTGNTYIITFYKNGDMSSDDNKRTLKVTGLTSDDIKNIQYSRTLWTDKDGNAIKGDGAPINNGETIDAPLLTTFQPTTGNLNGYSSSTKDIDSYIDQLNKLAKVLAFSVNSIESGKSDAADDPLPFFVNSDTAKYNNSDSSISNLSDVLNSESEITAGNISVNKQLVKDVMQIKTRTHDDQYAKESDNTQDGESDGARASAIASLQNTLLTIQNIGISVNSRADLFDASKGGSTLTNNGMTISSNQNGMTMDSYFKNTVDKLGEQTQEATRITSNQSNLLDSLNQSRMSVSGVSLDEEMANLIQFQHAYQASAKVISTVDELLDVVINGLKK